MWLLKKFSTAYITSLLLRYSRFRLSFFSVFNITLGEKKVPFSLSYNRIFWAAAATCGSVIRSEFIWQSIYLIPPFKKKIQKGTHFKISFPKWLTTWGYDGIFLGSSKGRQDTVTLKRDTKLNISISCKKNPFWNLPSLN